MVNMVEREVTYADLRDGDTVVDKSGNRWHAMAPAGDSEGMVDLWLSAPEQPTTPLHHVSKAPATPVRVLRPEGMGEEGDRLEADTPLPEPELSEAEVVAVMNDQLAASVIAEETHTEREVREKATVTGEPVVLPLFEEMTDLEKRSHLYLLHGVYAADVRFREALVSMHEECHADTSRDVAPHVHVAGTVVEG